MRKEEAAREEEDDERIAYELSEQFEREDEERQILALCGKRVVSGYTSVLTSR